jgi:hypothetical protein
MEMVSPWKVEFPRMWPLQREDNPVIDRIMRVVTQASVDLEMQARLQAMQQNGGTADDFW